jgi:cyclophilin family peptidyl-prolyl cis-trans isomerase
MATGSLCRAIGLLAGLLAAGCGGPDAEPSPATRDAPPAAAVAEPAVDYDQPFDKAATDQIGEDQRLPPDRTLAGKSTAALREAVEKAWPTIRLTDATRKPIPWVVTLDTDAGPIEITLRPDLAPNHCRNLLALVKVGYYDGLRFDRIVHQEAEDPEGGRSEIRLVRFGCPTGTGDPGVGHIGYHLQSEFSEERHGSGTVGFTRDADPSTAGVRLYITLAPAPVLDGSRTTIGKVSKGLDVVERIAAGKLLPPDVDPSRELPERPVVIRKATAGYK